MVTQISAAERAHEKDAWELIMIVDDNIANLKIAKNALSEMFDVLTVPSAAKMFDLLERNTPNMILLDIEMPEMDGYTAINLLKDNPKTEGIPVIFLTARGDSESELKGLTLGAVDYIAKPFIPELMRKRVEVHLMVESQKHMLENQTRVLAEQSSRLLDFNENLQRMVDEKTAKVLELQDAMLKTVANLVESRDNVTGEHIERTQRWLSILVAAMHEMNLYTEEMNTWDISLMVRSSQLHDVGKISISDAILNKPGRLTSEEFEEMKKHTTFGVEVIEQIEAGTSESDFLKYAKIFAGTHHEKWDGSGYPYGLSEERIPLQGRLMAIADVYDALISERPYKKAFSHKEAVEIIMEERGTHFDPVLADAFARVEGRFQSTPPTGR